MLLNSLVEVTLFQLKWCGHPLSVALPNFFPESECSILGLSNEVSFVSKSVCKKGENREKEKYFSKWSTKVEKLKMKMGQI